MRSPTGLSVPCSSGADDEMTPSGISVPLKPGGEVGVVGALPLPAGPGSVLPSARTTTKEARFNTTAPDDPETKQSKNEHKYQSRLLRTKTVRKQQLQDVDPEKRT
jgi:hypothetical protein